MSNIVQRQRPQRWDRPFDPDMSEAQVDELLQRPEFAAIDADRFPASMPLRGILLNDCRIRHCQPGDLILREGDYGNSAFLVLDGTLRVVIKPGLPSNLLGRAPLHKKSLLQLIGQAIASHNVRELDTRQAYPQSTSSGFNNLYTAPGGKKVFSPDADGNMQITDDYHTVALQSGAVVGEIAALGRVQRTATLYAESPATLLEMRWQALREIRRYDAGWRQLIEDRYRENLLYAKLASMPEFANLSPDTLKQIADATLFETYGSYEWSQAYKHQDDPHSHPIGTDLEPIVAAEGEYADGLLLIGAGFARISVKKGHGRRTIRHLQAGDHYGLYELYQGWKNDQNQALRTTLSALGYLHVLRIPAHVLHEWVFPNLQQPPRDPGDAPRSQEADALLEWAVSERFINGTQTMLIDQDRCVRCDDCVRACADAHEGNPRFIRHGEQHDHWLVANACMHCSDPVCMIGCPTGAIHRTAQGVVVINNDTCIGCATCANSCPYDNIRMVQIHDRKGQGLFDPDSNTPIMRATKCDLCASQKGGPACVRACPHDALQRIDFGADTLLETKAPK